MSVSARTRDRYRGSALKRAVDRIARASDYEPGTVLVPGTKVRENRQGAGVMTVSEQRENLVWVKERAGPYHITKLVAIDHIAHDADSKIVYNKLLGGWYVITGPHQTPLNGRFDSKEEAQLDRRK